MPMEKLFANESTESSTCTQEEPDAVSLRTREMTARGVATQNVQCRYHMERPCDCDRYFARPGTAEWGC
jgi:hypothetical protein